MYVPMVEAEKSLKQRQIFPLLPYKETVTPLEVFGSVYMLYVKFSSWCYPILALEKLSKNSCFTLRTFY